MRPGADIGDAAHGFEEFAFGACICFVRPGAVETSAVLEFSIGIKAEDIGRTDGVVCLCGVLCFIDQIREGEGVLVGEFLHVFKRISGVALCIIGHDGGDADAFGLQDFGVVHEAVDDCLNIRAVVTDKGNDGAFFAFDVIVGERLAVDVFKDEVGGGQGFVFLRCMKQSHILFPVLSSWYNHSYD